MIKVDWTLIDRGRSSYRAHTWESILESYHRLLQWHWPVGKMIDMVERIMASPYRSGLHGVTSHEVLMVGQHEHFGLCKAQLLVIEPPPRPASSTETRLTFHFQHWTTKTHDGFATLERFLRRVGWIVQYR